MAVTQSDVVSWWTLDEASGTRNDSKSTNHLTDNNTVGSTTGKKGNAANFVAGNSEYLSLNDNTAVSPTSSFTIGAWVHATDLASTRPVIIKDNASTQRSFSLVASSLSGVFKFAATNDGSNMVILSDPTDLSADTSYFVVAAFDDSANVIKISVNGTNFTTTAFTGTVWDSTAQFTVGGSADGGYGYMDGWVDEVFLLNRSIDNTEVAALYNSGSGVTYSDLSASGGGSMQSYFYLLANQEY